MKVKEVHSFKDLEEFLNKNPGTALIVRDIGNSQNAIMHTFGGNFCGDWKSGDGILFYEDGEQHSADSDAEFLINKIITF